MKIVIVGGVAGGASAACRLRRLDEFAEIVIFERSGYVSYANCGLPYYIGDIITNEQNLTLQTPSTLFKRFNICVKVSHEVVDIDPIKKEVKVVNLLNNEEFIESYDKLILSPGAKPILPSFYIGNKKVCSLRTVEDTLKIKNLINELKPQSACIIGAGYVGIEMAENLHNLGIKTSIIQLDSQVLNQFDFDMVSFIHQEILSKDINLMLKSKVISLEEVDNKIVVTLENNNTFATDLVIVSVGVIPENLLAKKASIDLDEKGCIVVNNNMQTSNPDIYAVGDVVSKLNIITNEFVPSFLAGAANKQGRIAANNICGIIDEYQGTLSTSILKVFDLSCASFGLNEKMCKEKGLNYEKIIISPMSHASYYPGGKVLTIKLLYNKDDLSIIGSQIVGYDGVDKRIDVLATASFLKSKVIMLKDLDLAYAPPYSSAKDPVNFLGFIAENIENNLVKQFYYEDLNKLSKDNNIILLDTRTSFEYQRGSAAGFIHIPLDELRSRLDELEKNKKIYVMCQSGLRSYLACRILNQYGFECYNFAGGYRLYSAIYNSEKLVKESYDCGKDFKKI